ncbi:cell division site-positioning protein MapZ family protein [Neobacillus sp. LXY-1]|uniref:cell division site-positioning protein MapZ family protein n=1 Tax=Neobacillus sp. LXY-1 TaxID=3379133 RepID=UPI003EE07813
MKKLFAFLVATCLLALSFSFNLTEADAAGYDKAYAAKTLVVKSSPGSSYKTLGEIKAGHLVEVYGGVAVGKDQDNWYSYQQYGFSKIKYNNKYAYVKTDDLRFADPFNWAPGVKSEVIKSVYNNQYVTKQDKIKLVKLADSSKKGSPGFYTMYVQQNGKGKWIELITINCKTGWYHG